MTGGGGASSPTGRPLIVIAGEAIFDLIPDGTTSGVYRSALGGSSFNTSIGLARLNAPAAFCGRLSRDDAGAQFMARLEGAGVDVSLVSRSSKPSALALVAAGTQTSGPRYSLYLDGTTHEGPAGLPKPWPARAVHLHAASFHALLGPSGNEMLAAMRDLSGRITISFDPNIRPAVLPPPAETAPLVEARVAASTIVKASEEDLVWLYPHRTPEESIIAWSQLGPTLAILTRGGDGAVAFSQQGRIEVAAPKVEVVDTVGAGDSFTAALLASLWRRGALSPTGVRDLSPQALTDCLAFAAMAAAINCARRGADPPTDAEIEAFGATRESLI